MLVLKNVSVKADTHDILNNVNLEFGPGVHFVVGPNGAGKSTLSHAIMANPSYKVSGDMQLDNQPIHDLSTHERARLGLFLSFQSPTPIEGLSNFKLIKEALELTSVPKIMDKLNGFKGLAKDLNLPADWDKKDLNVHASGGEKKKNELIQMVMLDPKVAILDEPDSGLDVDAINDLIKQLKQFAEKGKTIIIVSHYEKLLKSFTPASVTVVANGTATQSESSNVIDQILTNGFKEINEFT